MEGFERILRRVDRRLETPEPERSRILLEIAGDLEDLYESYRRRGIAEAEARRKAATWFDLSDDAAEQLRSIHVRWPGRVLDRLEASTRGRLQATVLGLVRAADRAPEGGGAVEPRTGRTERRGPCGPQNVDHRPSWTTSPSTTVYSTSRSLRLSGGTSKGLRSSTTRSASFPGSIDPFRVSRPSAHALFTV